MFQVMPVYRVAWVRDEQGREVEARLRVNGADLADFIRTLSFNQVKSVTINLEGVGEAAAYGQTIMENG